MFYDFETCFSYLYQSLVMLFEKHTHKNTDVDNVLKTNQYW